MRLPTVVRSNDQASAVRRPGWPGLVAVITSESLRFGLRIGSQPNFWISCGRKNKSDLRGSRILYGTEVASPIVGNGRNFPGGQIQVIDIVENLSGDGRPIESRGHQTVDPRPWSTDL